MAKNKIADFGKKIGGARKDLRGREITSTDLGGLTDEEKILIVKKQKIWRKPDYAAIAAEKGKEAAYFIKEAWNALPDTPPDNTEEGIARYVSFIETFRNTILEAHSVNDLIEWWGDFVRSISKYYSCERGGYVLQDQYALLFNKRVRALSRLLRDDNLAKAVEKKHFLYTEEDKYFSMYAFCYIDSKNTWAITQDNEVVAGGFVSRGQAEEFMRNIIRETLAELKSPENNKKKPRKKAFSYSSLENVRFSGIDPRKGKNISGNDLMSTFHFRGGEFGKSLSHKERQENLNAAYESFYSMAKVLNISLSDVSLGGKLAIAFGSRGNGKAMAHYEPSHEVINLTRMSGAGSLAHEWGHAMDDILNKSMGATGLLQKGSREELTQSQRLLHDDMKVVDGQETEYMRSSRQTDSSYTHSGHGYWASEHEMFARAFACFVADKLNAAGIVCDYLVAHSDMGPTPQGEERKRLNRDFEELLQEFKNRGLLHDFVEPEAKHAPCEAEESADSTVELFEGAYGQFDLFAPKAAACRV